MNLYMWTPNTHGPKSFIVVADSEEAARDAVRQHIDRVYPVDRHGQIPTEAYGWPTSGWELTVYEPGQVAEHWNE